MPFFWSRSVPVGAEGAQNSVNRPGNMQQVSDLGCRYLVTFYSRLPHVIPVKSWMVKTTHPNPVRCIVSVQPYALSRKPPITQSPFTNSGNCCTKPLHVMRLGMQINICQTEPVPKRVAMQGKGRHMRTCALLGPSPETDCAIKTGSTSAVKHCWAWPCSCKQPW